MKKIAVVIFVMTSMFNVDKL